MAFSSVALPQRPTNGFAAKPAAEAVEVEEYGKILRLRDEIFAGTHPRLRTPSHLQGKLGHTSVPSSSLQKNVAQSASEFQGTMASQPDLSTHRSTGATDASSEPHSHVLIQPGEVFRSDNGLVVEQPQSQRLQIEAELRLAQNEPCDEWELVGELSIPGVLKKAMALLTPDPPTPDPTAAQADGSHDERSYYSSQRYDSLSTNDAEMGETRETMTRVGESRDEASPAPVSRADLSSIPARPLLPSNNRADPPNGSKDKAPKMKSHSGQRGASLTNSLPGTKAHGKQGKAKKGLAAETVAAASRTEINDTSRGPERGRRAGRSARRALRRPISPVSPQVPVYRNHIRSPQCPQPARVSPLIGRRTLETGGKRAPNVATQSLGSSLPPSVYPWPITNPKKRSRLAIREVVSDVNTIPVGPLPEPRIKRERTTPVINSIPEITQHHEGARLRRRCPELDARFLSEPEMEQAPAKKRRSNKPRTRAPEEAGSADPKVNLPAFASLPEQYARNERVDLNTADAHGRYIAPSAEPLMARPTRYVPPTPGYTQVRYVQSPYSPTYEHVSRGRSPILERPVRYGSRVVTAPSMNEERYLYELRPRTRTERLVRIQERSPSPSPILVRPRPTIELERPSSFPMGPPSYPTTQDRRIEYVAPTAPVRSSSRQASIVQGGRPSGSMAGAGHEYHPTRLYDLAYEEMSHGEATRPVQLPVPTSSLRSASSAVPEARSASQRISRRDVRYSVGREPRAMIDPHHTRLDAVSGAHVTYVPVREEISRPLVTESAVPREYRHHTRESARLSHQRVIVEAGLPSHATLPAADLSPGPEFMRPATRLHSVRPESVLYERPVVSAEYQPGQYGRIQFQTSSGSEYQARPRDHLIRVEAEPDAQPRDYVRRGSVAPHAFNYHQSTVVRPVERGRGAYTEIGTRYVTLSDDHHREGMSNAESRIREEYPPRRTGSVVFQEMPTYEQPGRARIAPSQIARNGHDDVEMMDVDDPARRGYRY